MKTLEIIGYKRANLGKADSKALRNEGMVPCVVYGQGKQIHFYSPAILFRDLVYTKAAHFVKLNIEGEEVDAIMQDIQFHPVSENILHIDFFEFVNDKPIKMDIPIELSGTSPAIVAGGNLIMKKKKLSIKALSKDMPEEINVDITSLNFGKPIKVADLTPENYEILDAPQSSIAVAEVPRALRGKTDMAAEAAEG
ncbi:50S ribosomal protein L25/general stress protein Ctc [Reichenbachiella versicolor]|uniref:50S ribosomal protein L25/general stress protein Ctc n=1 Tax=Reichenbachiella versicolor TaxID=1821036 RepID=UPI000D6E24A5|nr:50S ribosomal protein L25/general stress protein Ctc [Reichenbachiella versicolor]